MNDTIYKIGVIGFGLRAEYMIRNIKQFQLSAKVTCICDIEWDGPKNRLKTLQLSEESIHFYHDYLEMMEHEVLDGIMIATCCNNHTEIACNVMKYNIPIFLEKPVSITEEQLELLSQAEKKFKPNVLVSFPLRVTPLCQKAKEIIDNGTLGTISQFQAVNNVSYARVYYHTWFKDESLTGGLFLQKSTHDIDVIQYLLDEIPSSITAMESKVIFKGSKPEGLTCPKCPEYRTCPESSYVIANQHFDHVDGELCCFAQDTGNHDSGSILMQFENGVHGFYSQNFVARKSAAQRSYRVIGYLATMEFDFATSVIKIQHHNSGTVETITIDSHGLNHFGGDKVLMENFIAMMAGKEKSYAPLLSGIESARSCLMAKRSAKDHVFVAR
ncbi:MAG: Gfo/Idh/MocA family oxidoreductase [Eubacteriales bacterium]